MSGQDGILIYEWLFLVFSISRYIYGVSYTISITMWHLGAIFTICPDIIFIGSWIANFGGYLGHHVWPYLLLS